MSTKLKKFTNYALHLRVKICYTDYNNMLSGEIK